MFKKFKSNLDFAIEVYVWRLFFRWPSQQAANQSWCVLFFIFGIVKNVLYLLYIYITQLEEDNYLGSLFEKIKVGPKPFLMFLKRFQPKNNFVLSVFILCISLGTFFERIKMAPKYVTYIFFLSF